ncbi:MAG: hypothetical protein APF81_22040 [Desulfosporosinus sp. BRH_c37]|nr:MAG: hypothetical protein APF81_22040 [Desulfosporosinus sp. BRH_c37]
MAKAITETCPGTTLNISTEKILQAHVNTSGVMKDKFRVRRICTKTDDALKSVMKAHLEERASNY